MTGHSLSDDARRYAATAGYELLDRASLHTVVLLHGLGGDRNQPLGLVTDRFTGWPLTVLAPDARAHGDTALVGSPERFTSTAMAEDLHALIERLGIDGPLIVVGISMGAAVALRVARSLPDRVVGTLAIRPSFGTVPWPDHLRVFSHIADVLLTAGPAGAATFAAGTSYRDVARVSPSAAASLLEQFSKPDAVVRVTRLANLPADTPIDWTGRLELGSPFTIVAAEGDPNHPRHIADLWHDRIAHSELTTIPSRDDAPATYAAGLDRAVRDFVGRFDAKGSATTPRTTR